jgi:Na+/phosphate symporter
MKKEKTDRQVILKVQPSLYSEFEAICSGERRTISEVVRELIINYTNNATENLKKKAYVDSFVSSIGPLCAAMSKLHRAVSNAYGIATFGDQEANKKEAVKVWDDFDGIYLKVRIYLPKTLTTSIDNWLRTYSEAIMNQCIELNPIASKEEHSIEIKEHFETFITISTKQVKEMENIFDEIRNLFGENANKSATI